MNKKYLLQLGMVVFLVFFSSISHICGDETAFFRIIPIPKEEHGYSNFDTVIITSQNELDTLLFNGSNRQVMGWNKRADFEKVISQATLDFDRESLVLIRHTEGSSSVHISFLQPRVKKNRIICEIIRKEPKGALLGDMVFYCFALVIDKTKITEVEMQITGRKPFILSIKK